MKKQNSILSCILFMVFLFSACSQSRTSSPPSNNNSTNERPIKEESQKKECYFCKGTGMVTCSICGGTGINSMGTDCGCVMYVANMRAMGKEPTKTAKRWTCENCKGTGYAN